MVVPATGIVLEVGSESVLLETPSGIRLPVPLRRGVRPEVLDFLRRRLGLPVWIRRAADGTADVLADSPPIAELEVVG